MVGYFLFRFKCFSFAKIVAATNVVGLVVVDSILYFANKSASFYIAFRRQLQWRLTSYGALGLVPPPSILQVYGHAYKLPNCNACATSGRIWHH